MGSVQIVDNLVAKQWERGSIVAEELVGDVERLVGLGAVLRIPDDDAPEEPVVVEEPPAPEPEPPAPENDPATVVTATTD